MATTIYGSKIGGYWQTYMTYTITSDNNYYYASVQMGLYTYANKWIKSGTRKATLSGTGQTSVTKSKSNTKESGGTKYQYCSASWKWARGTSAVSKTLTASIKYTGSDHNGTSTCSYTFSVAAKPKYTVAFNANGGSGAPGSVSQFIGSAVTLPSGRPTRTNYSFVSWNTNSGGTGTNYNPSASFPAQSANSTTTLYAKWVLARQYPSATLGDITISGYTKDGEAIQYYSNASVDVNDVFVDPNTGTSLTATFTLTDKDGNSQSTNTTIQNGNSATLTISNISLLGELSSKIELYDSLLTSVDGFGKITTVSPTFNVKCSDDLSDTTMFKVLDTPPDIDEKGKGMVTVYALKYDKSTTSWTNDWEAIGDRFEIVSFEYTVGADTFTGWTFKFDADDNTSVLSLPERCVDMTNNEVYIKAEWRNTYSQESVSRTAFYSTSRNANYNTGLANNVFVGSVDSVRYPEYSSRVWYSYVNNPLYFPDTNYIEVGSNDTDVMGMVKVGEYLGVIKQSKATDTSIYLAYATSFEDDTTFATKQAVSGVGAVGKYCFNVLGDETLFFSPEGIMAIVPSEDDQHKVQLRSYYLNKKLLAEDAPETSYSFVYDGKYILCVNNHAYVLDGNQKTSWETSKTNLQYEAYYWDNIPARFLMENGGLWFATETSLCRFKDKTEDFAYNDNGEPIRAEWTTIFDDDGALHYYKTMQKKGNLVSILPCDFKDNNIIEAEWEGFTDQQKEEAYNENPRKYYLKKGNFYIRCKDTDEYDGEQTYYQSTLYTSADVYVRKDVKDITYIGRVDGTIEEPFDTPNELFINKKFKKYKRLQFVVANNEMDECFGVDSIVKNYTIGNYCKR